MTRSITLHSNARSSEQAGKELGAAAREGLDGASPDALIVFASSRHNYRVLLEALDRACSPGVIVGCSSAGEFNQRAADEGAVSGIAIRSDSIAFRAALGRNLRTDRAGAARALVDGFQGMSSREFPYRGALVLTDALAGHADDLVEQLTILTAGTYQLFGGGAGDDANFTRTHVFFGTEAVPDAAVALEILSHKPIGVGVKHGWEPATDPLRVTETAGVRVISLNNIPACEVFHAYARKTGQVLEEQNPVPFFLHNVLGIETPSGYRLRVPLAVDRTGAVQCAAEVPSGALVRIMKPREGSAQAAAEAAVAQLNGAVPATALFFDCVATRLRMGRDFGFELDALQRTLCGAGYAGCNTYGQIARSEGQFSGFHNCTAVVAVLPE